MRHRSYVARSIVVAIALLAGCAAETGTGEEVGAAAEELTDPTFVVGGWYWGYIVNPVGDRKIDCPDGTRHTLCFVDLIDFRESGLTSAQQSTVRSRMDAGGYTEAAAGVLSHGRFVTRRDHRDGSTRYVYLPSDVYLSPVQRTHSDAYTLLDTRTGTSEGTIQVAYAIDTSWPVWVDVTWDLPAGESPPPGSLYEDIYVTGRRNGTVSYPQTEPVEVILDQYFLKVRPLTVAYPVGELKMY